MSLRIGENLVPDGVGPLYPSLNQTEVREREARLAGALSGVLVTGADVPSPPPREEEQQPPLEEKEEEEAPSPDTSKLWFYTQHPQLSASKTSWVAHSAVPAPASKWIWHWVCHHRPLILRNCAHAPSSLFLNRKGHVPNTLRTWVTGVTQAALGMLLCGCVCACVCVCAGWYSPSSIRTRCESPSLSACPCNTCHASRGAPGSYRLLCAPWLQP